MTISNRVFALGIAVIIAIVVIVGMFVAPELLDELLLGGGLLSTILGFFAKGINGNNAIWVILPLLGLSITSCGTLPVQGDISVVESDNGYIGVSRSETEVSGIQIYRASGIEGSRDVITTETRKLRPFPGVSIEDRRVCDWSIPRCEDCLRVVLSGHPIELCQQVIE